MSGQARQRLTMMVDVKSGELTQVQAAREQESLAVPDGRYDDQRCRCRRAYPELPQNIYQEQPAIQLPKVGYSKREAARMLGISERTIERLVNRGLLRPSRALRTPRFSPKELERLIADTAYSP